MYFFSEKSWDNMKQDLLKSHYYVNSELIYLCFKMLNIIAFVIEYDSY